MDIFVINIEPTICFGVLPIDEYTFELPKKDSLILENITHQNKRKEFLASRFLAKKMLEKQGIKYIGLDKNIFNAPFIESENIYISLSHSTYFTAFAINHLSKIGIDIESKRPTLFKLQYKFLSEKERLFVNNDLDLLTYFWAAKEALYKLYQQKKLSFAEDMEIDWENKKAILFPNSAQQQFFSIFDWVYEDVFLVCVY
ncbi:MAG: 4'-phosphopantetheinyl transferase superfamily protein [Bacteroidetes bacterium]|nr:MAG: 4'-phosphopantetheinyl transferase superfamily protein [Bacteroidota bacterium]TAG86526.1 MAG: 4'-phosphopantetheinyl transferase superfamily protein [Bacteroidota bacterium]